MIRSRDRLIPLYNDAREAMGLKRAVKWSDITSDIEIAQRLIDTYGDIDRVEAFIGGLAEDHVKGSDFGELFYKSFYDQVRETARKLYLQRICILTKTKFIFRFLPTQLVDVDKKLG